MLAWTPVVTLLCVSFLFVHSSRVADLKSALRASAEAEVAAHTVRDVLVEIPPVLRPPKGPASWDQQLARDNWCQLKIIVGVLAIMGVVGIVVNSI